MTHIRGSFREMIAIALPMVVSQSCDTIMIFTNRLFLSRLGPEFMNAAMGGGLTVFMMMSFFLGLISYTTALVAQYFGAQKKQNCSKVVFQAIIISIMAYPLILFCAPLAHKLFEVMKVSTGQLHLQKIYFNVLLYAVIISLLRNCLSCFFSGIGKTRIVMVSSFTAMIVNIILNYVLVFGKFGFPCLGIYGAAYGNIIGSLSGLIILILAYFSNRYIKEFDILKSFHFDWVIFKKMFRFGSSVGTEMFLNVFAFNMMVLLFHAQGLVTATAATIVLNWDLVSFVPLIGIEIGVMSLVGRAMGAGDIKIAHKSVISGLKLGFIYSAIVFIGFIVFPEFLVRIFKTNVSETIFVQATPMAVYMIRLASIYVVVETLFVVFIGALRGAGDTFWAMGISVTLHWIMVLVVDLSLNVFKFSPQVAWSGIVLVFFVFSIIVYLRYRTGHWKKIRVVHHEKEIIPADGFHEPVDL